MTLSAVRRPRSGGRRRFLGQMLATVAAPALAGCSLFDDDEKPILAGHRTNVLNTRNGLVVTKNDGTLTPISIPATTSVTEWPIAGRIPSHISANYAWGGLHKRWSQSIGHGNSEPDFLAFAALGSSGRGVIQAQPVLHEGRLFTVDAVGEVRAYSWPAMKELWHLNAKPRSVKSSNLGGGLGAFGNTLYIVDGVSQTVAVDTATGSVKWRMTAGTPGRSAPTIANGRVFFGTIDEKLYALDANTGHELWSYSASQADTVMFGQPAPTVVDGIVLCGFGSGDLVALREESGEVVWSDTLGSANGQTSALDFSCVRSMPVVVAGTAYAMSVASVLVAIDMRSGRRLWERAVAGQSPLLSVNDWLFLLSMDEQVACVDRQTGQVRWITQLRRYRRVDARKDGVVWTGPVLAGGKLVCVSTLPENGVVTLDPLTGKILTIDKLPNATSVQPIVVDGQLLVLDDVGNLTSYG
ncbi:PQQ-like beta-propeller repeat protein [Acetobacter sacchari]|uniref:PQQ-like beta-propeller repeat protein n=1 Tax=Acetobacter sacchari TaxID=2661687 RepID=A0ABS3LUC0_9PROT|nr:PQQ-like beta-propeller repeat protein [Acetobacter sacchari]